MKILRHILFATTLAVISAGCSPRAARTSPANEADEAVRSLQDRYSNLADALRTLPSVQVARGDAYYGGASSLNGDTRLRVAAEGRIVGTVSEAEQLYPLNQIRAVRLIKPNDAQQRYGLLGANGVIELILLEG